MNHINYINYISDILLDYGIKTTIKGTRLKETLVILDKEEEKE